MKKLLFIAVCAGLLYGCGNPPATEEKTETAVAPADTTPKAVEFADLTYTDTGKKMFEAMSGGDMDTYLQPFADNAVYNWNNGDSLSGKQAISDFWRKRRLEEIETLTFSDAIWLPVKVNQPQSVEAPGVWLLGWAKVDAVYKNKKTMTQWMHWTIHFNESNQIDRMNQYVDTAPISAVMPMKIK